MRLGEVGVVKESQLHASVAGFLDLVLRPPAFYTTFPSGWGALTRATAGRLKHSGLKAGMPDILLFYDHRCFGMELKTNKGRLSPQQKATILDLTRAGMSIFVCRSLADIALALKRWGIPTKPIHDQGSKTCESSHLQSL